MNGDGYQVSAPFCVACADAKFNTQTGTHCRFPSERRHGRAEPMAVRRGQKATAKLWGMKNKEGPPYIRASVCKGGMVYNMTATAFADPANCSCPNGTFLLDGKCLKRQFKPPPVATGVPACSACTPQEERHRLPPRSRCRRRVRRRQRHALAGWRWWRRWWRGNRSRGARQAMIPSAATRAFGASLLAFGICLSPVKPRAGSFWVEPDMPGPRE